MSKAMDELIRILRNKEILIEQEGKQIIEAIDFDQRIETVQRDADVKRSAEVMKRNILAKVPKRYDKADE